MADDMQLDGPPSPEARAPGSPPSPPAGGDDVAGEFLSAEVVRTRLASMTAAEGDYAVVPHDYMTTVQRHGMTADWREKIYRWYGQLSESFALSETSVQCALNFLDRYLCATPRPRFDSHARARSMHHHHLKVLSHINIYRQICISGIQPRFNIIVRSVRFAPPHLALRAYFVVVRTYRPGELFPGYTGVARAGVFAWPSTLVLLRVRAL